jgi:hypothetical protein
MSHPTEMADADEPGSQHMQKRFSQELVDEQAQ